MKKVSRISIFLLVFFALNLNAKINTETAKKFTGLFKLEMEILNKTEKPCSPNIQSIYWFSYSILDFQYEDRNNGIEVEDKFPSFREELNALLIDTHNKVVFSKNKKFKYEYTAESDSFIAMKVFEKNWLGKYNFNYGYNLSAGEDILSSFFILSIEEFDNDGVVKQCKYIKVD
ncbi:MAG: hypothetical protein A2504_11715 [Bdellovibrionales bacterium RIFOXYD12_FULL_39_22]|nr:MAG: hypothetical protein A2385_16230 [Bdellovibrionales bacterium RIFOXYB1_FULL_39_21]OFZ44494.1 MAG: hypothetical protein A2485_06665 [Bdellovibrionales bacterium RIFOXYC12_FULL_39_17]OFZ49864.1 MAG: hypothetical protein A2404_00800 [Bdellovibrionales bacterium RIFOXYC1_FULL_39_130]OFZ72079.1 MAG: hypothetical protein A2451_11015 [Bdellovibrionales bacterium RIFOXYC2_FULL_39_8]OFZ76869.1 MAG: hypothetical protein A2560_05600 [Bdellovibrionales bacterium RIFOXYD1_FULL_39_84]OFZ95796.1 MAG: